ncbi:MAG: phosphoglycerate mutase family protein [Candidatus Heimdallarchaeota archaeon]|nr:phosphoglycerate mutase family protein [Candidatus Heimdallarchaeota archaeon]
MKLHLIRHGESEGNKSGIIQGKMDFPLTERGKLQAERLNLLLKQLFPYAKIAFSSTLRRSFQTMIRATDLPILSIEELNQRDFGYFEGKKLTKLSKAERVIWNSLFLENKYTGKEVESLDDFNRRIDTALGLIAHYIDDHDEVLIFTHSSIISELLKRIGNQRMSLGNAKIISIKVTSMSNFSNIELAQPQSVIMPQQ